MSKSPVLVNMVQALVAILLGNLIYFAVMPSLPFAAQHHRFQFDLGTVIDFSICLAAYWLIRTTKRWR